MAAINDSWAALRALPLVVGSYELDRLSATFAYGFERVTTRIRLIGEGSEGWGEDVSPYEDEAATLHVMGPVLPLTGEWTLESFCDHLAEVDQWAAAPEWEMARRWRNWAFESAALDLALRQADIGLAAALGRTPAPVRFVNSLGLGDPPEIGAVSRRLERYPDLRFKLDAQATWSPELTAAVAGTGAVDVVDFKGRYGLPVEDEFALLAMYETVLERFPDPILEDPHDRPDVAALVAPHAARVSFDAPIATTQDVESAAFGARTVNVKPSRIGSLRALLEIYAHCERAGIAMYGGGMGEVGVARGQIELLAALFHPDAPNDVAPSAYNMPDLPAGLPQSPLSPRDGVIGFRWD